MNVKTQLASINTFGTLPRRYLSIFPSAIDQLEKLSNKQLFTWLNETYKCNFLHKLSVLIGKTYHVERTETVLL